VEKDDKSDPELSQRLAAFLAHHPEIIKDWLDEDPSSLARLATHIEKETREDKESAPSVGGPGGETPGCQAKRTELLDLILDISDELDLEVLSHKILVNLARLTNADRCSLFLVRGSPKQLEPQLCLVGPDQTLDSVQKKAVDPVVIPWGEGLVGGVANSGKLVNVIHADHDPRFNPSLDHPAGYRVRSTACLPIRNSKGEVAGVAQILNARSPGGFDQQDLEIFAKYLTFASVGLQNAVQFQVSTLEYKKNQLLLSLARSLFQEQSSLDRLITTIIREAKDMLKCERCTVFLLDLKIYEELEEEAWQVKDFLSQPSLVSTTSTSPSICSSMGTTGKSCEEDTASQTESLKEEQVSFQVAYEMNNKDNETRIYPCNKLGDTKRLEIAKYVAVTSEVLNLDQVDDWGGNEEEDVHPRSMLTLPIYNGQNTVIGVAQLTNKVNGKQFDQEDISLTEAFAIFCGIGIHNTKTYEAACKLMAKQRVALDCLSYHATASDNDTYWLARENIPPAEEFNLYSYKFNDTIINDSLTLKCVLRMFLDFDLINKFNIPHKVVCRWALSVKKNYRPVKYHNWRHALNVCQTMFTMLKTGKMDRFMDELEVFGLLVACLCHDLDHRGTNNSYQTKVDSPLAVLYSTSTMEHHHFDQCVMILSSEGNNIFQGLSTDQYKTVMRVVEMAILSTDLASYFEKKKRFREVADGGEIDWQAEDRKKVLCGMLMTAADVSAIAKPWELQHQTARLVADEFFDQGDMERLQLNITPMGMMDRDRKDELPEMQVEFIDRICVPLYRTLSDSFPWIKPLLDGALGNRAKWADLQEKVEMGLTWIDHDVIEVPVEEIEAGRMVAEDLELTVETLRCKEDREAGGLVKKKSFRSMRNPVRPPVGFFNRRLSTRQNSSSDKSPRMPNRSASTTDVESHTESDAERGETPDEGSTPPSIVVSQPPT